MKDVFLDKFEYFTLLERNKINDDITGSNQQNNWLTGFEDNSVFSIWRDEEFNYGVKLDNSGNVAGDVFTLNSYNILFFNERESVGTWVNKLMIQLTVPVIQYMMKHLTSF
jgi:hypothetical protein